MKTTMKTPMRSTYAFSSLVIACNYDFHSTSSPDAVSQVDVKTVLEDIIILVSLLLTLRMITSRISGLSMSLSGCIKRQLTVSPCQQHGHNKKIFHYN